MESLAIKTPEGRWREGFAKAEASTLSWYETADAAKPSQVLALGKRMNVQKVQFGLRKNVFALDAGNGTPMQFSAASDAARTTWIKVIYEAAGLKAPQEEGNKENRGNARVGKISAPPGRVSGLQNLLQGLPGGTALGGGMMTEAQARDKLQQKLQGKVEVRHVSEDTCLVCEKRMDADDQTQLSGGVSVHSDCMYCSKCACTVTASDCIIDSNARILFCPAHDPAKAAPAAPRREGMTNDAVLARPRVNARRRRPTKPRPALQQLHDDQPDGGAEELQGGHEAHDQGTGAEQAGQPLEPSETHANAFTIELDERVGSSKKGKRKELRQLQSNVVVVCCEQAADKRQWVKAIANAQELAQLKDGLCEAQRVDMYAAIQAQMDIETFEQTHKTEHESVVLLCLKNRPKKKKKGGAAANKKGADAAATWTRALIKLHAEEGLTIYDGTESSAKVLAQIKEIADGIFTDAATETHIVFVAPAPKPMPEASASAGPVNAPAAAPLGAAASLEVRIDDSSLEKAETRSAASSSVSSATGSADVVEEDATTHPTQEQEHEQYGRDEASASNVRDEDDAAGLPPPIEVTTLCAAMREESASNQEAPRNLKSASAKSSRSASRKPRMLGASFKQRAKRLTASFSRRRSPSSSSPSGKHAGKPSSPVRRLGEDGNASPGPRESLQQNEELEAKINTDSSGPKQVQPPLVTVSVPCAPCIPEQKEEEEDEVSDGSAKDDVLGSDEGRASECSVASLQKPPPSIPQRQESPSPRENSVASLQDPPPSIPQRQEPPSTHENSVASSQNPPPNIPSRQGPPSPRENSVASSQNPPPSIPQRQEPPSPRENGVANASHGPPSIPGRHEPPSPREDAAPCPVLDLDSSQVPAGLSRRPSPRQPSASDYGSFLGAPPNSFECANYNVERGSGDEDLPSDQGSEGDGNAAEAPVEWPDQNARSEGGNTRDADAASEGEKTVGSQSSEYCDQATNCVIL